jgi:hypothetical protein
MGFWGTLVVHRHAQPLDKLLTQVAMIGDVDTCFGSPEGWQVTQLSAGFRELPADFLAELRDVTVAPVLAAEVWDSDTALVHALGLHTADWTAWLRPTVEFGPSLDPLDAEGSYLDGSTAAAAAIAWAVEAGLEPASPEEVAEVLNGGEAFAEDLFFELLIRLGIAIDDVGPPDTPGDR